MVSYLWPTWFYAKFLLQMSHTLAFNSTLPVLKRLSLIWDNFNIHHIGLVVRRVFQNQPQVHTPNSIHNCGKSKQWRNISSCQFNNLIKIPHRHIVVQIAIHKNSCAWIIKQYFRAGVYFSGVSSSIKNATSVFASFLPLFLFFSEMPSQTDLWKALVELRVQIGRDSYPGGSTLNNWN